MITQDFTGGALDTLIALVERGPVFDGDIPSKVGRDKLLEMGFAFRTIVNGEDGYQAVTYKGLSAYLKRYNAETIREAIENRKRIARMPN